MVKFVCNKPVVKMPELIKTEFGGKTYSSYAIRKVLKRHGYSYYKVPNKPGITDIQKAKRLRWVK